MTYNAYGSSRENSRRSHADKPYHYKPGFGVRYEPAKKRGKSRLILTVLLLVALAFILGSVLVGFFTSYFDLKKISVSGVGKYPDEEIILTSGIEAGTKLYSIDGGEAEENILSAYPEIADVKVRKVFPSEVLIELTYETPKYFICVTGEYFTLSESLRVIERCPGRKSLEESRFIYLEMPNVKRAVTGERIEFFGDDEEYIKSVLDSLSESAFSEDIDRIYIKAKFDISFVKVGEYKINMGDYKDQRLKLLMAEKMMESGGYRGMTGVIFDVSDASESSVMVSKTLKIE